MLFYGIILLHRINWSGYTQGTLGAVVFPPPESERQRGENDERG